jgi:hypothetical protein
MRKIMASTPAPSEADTGGPSRGDGMSTGPDVLDRPTGPESAGTPDSSGTGTVVGSPDHGADDSDAIVTDRPWSWRRIGPAAVSIAIYLALSVAIFWHVWSTDPTAVSQTGGDQFGTMWFLQWFPFAILHGHSPFFSNFANYPYGVNLLTNTSVPLLGVLASPITLIWGSIASFNVLITLALPASATAGYFFALRWVAWRPAAFVAGLLYGFSPYEIAQSSGHLNLTFIVFPPLILLVVHELLVRQHGSPRRWGIVLGLLAAGQFFISSELLASTVVIGAICAVVGAVAGYRSVQSHLRHAAAGLAWAAGTTVVLLVYPAWFAVRGPGHISGPIQLVPQGYRADLLGPVIPDSLLRIAPSHLAQIADKFSNSPTENGSYLGITLLLVLAVGTVVLWRRSVVVRVTAIAGAAAFVLSLGASLVVEANPPGSATGFPLPEWILTKLPLLSNTIPVRYSLYVTLFAALLLAVILDQLHAALAERRPLAHSSSRRTAPDRRIMATVVPLLVSVVVLVPLVPVAPFTAIGPVGTPAYFTSPALQQVPSGSVAVVYPYPTSKVPNAQAWQAASRMRFRMPGGYFLVPQGPDNNIAFSPTLAYTRTTLTAQVLSQLVEGAPPPESPALRSALLAEFRAWHVRTVIAFPTLAANPAQSVQFLTWLLGAPPKVQPGAAHVWYGID